MDNSVYSAAVTALWFADLKSQLAEGETFRYALSADLSSLDCDILPQVSPTRALEMLRASGTRGSVVTKVRGFTIDVGSFAPASRSLAVSELELFCEVGRVSKDADMEYVRALHVSLGLDVDYLKCGDRLISLNPSNSEVSVQHPRRHILIGTPIHRRPEVTRIYLTYMNRFLIPQLAWRDYIATVVLCGDKDDFEGVRDVFDPKLNFFVDRPNVLGDKKNTILGIARDLGSEYLAWIDSDDMISPQTLLDLVNKAAKNGHWSSIREFAFLESRSGEMVAYAGYPPNHQLRTYGMGSGRIFTRRLLGLLPDAVFPSRNKSMDDGVRGVLDEIKIPEELRMVEGLAQWPLGIKSGVNLWDFGHYKGDSIGFSDTRVSWVPLEIQRLLSTLRDQPPGTPRRS